MLNMKMKVKYQASVKEKARTIFEAAIKTKVAEVQEEHDLVPSGHRALRCAHGDGGSFGVSCGGPRELAAWAW